MPSIYTHTHFAKEVYNRLDKIIQNQLTSEMPYYIMFSQSFDNFFYYNFLSFRKGKDLREFGRFAHQHNVSNYFKNIISYIKSHPSDNLKAYLYGSLNHYCSDSTLHPYIIYKTRDYYKNHLLAYKYKSLHTKYEFMLDKYYYEKSTQKDFSKYFITKDILQKIQFSSKYIDCLNYVFKKSFQKENIGEVFAKSHNQSNFIFRFLITDSLGWKKKIYTVFDFFFPHKKYKFADCTFRIKEIDSSFLNYNHLTWHNPFNKNLKYSYSWDELFNLAIQKSTKLINKCEEYFQGKTSLDELLTLIGNNSYTTGLPCDNK